MNISKRPPFDFSASPDESPVLHQPANVDFGGARVIDTPLIEPQSAFGTPPAPVREPSAAPVYLAAFVVTVLWAGAPIAYAVGFRQGVSPLQYDPFAIAVFALLAIGPMVLIWIAAYLLRQGMKLAAEARRGRELADQMLAPAALACSEAGSVIEAVRRQIDEAAASAVQARAIMATLRETLALETERLDQAAALSVRATTDAAERLGAERTKLDGLSSALAEQATAIIGATDVAAEVTTAAGRATGDARIASEDLARHVARLETAGGSVGDQMRAVEQELTQQRAALLELAERLRGEQQGFAMEADSRIARLGALVEQSRGATADVIQSAQHSAEGIQHLTAAAAERFGELTQAARLERDALTMAAEDSIGRITAAAAEARRAAEAHAEGAQARVDQLNEAAFEARKKADDVFEARLNEARGLIEQSAGMVDQAGDKARERLEGWITTAREALADVERVLADISARAEALPAEAERRAEALRVSMQQNLGDLMTSARTAAEETQALDAAFQHRVRANYDMLSEAVRLMGLVAGEPMPPMEALKPVADAPFEPPAPSLRPRLRLTSVASNEEFQNALDAAAAKTPPEPDGLGWKGLLESLERDGADPEQLTQRMISEVKGVGNPEALLPSDKIDQIAVAVQAGDTAGASEVVRSVARSATQKLSRRLFADAALRGQSERYRRRFSAMLRDAAERDQQGGLVTSLLASDEGRAWLLLDAAAADRP